MTDARDLYNRIAHLYNARVETKPHNAYCDRPAVLGLLPDLNGRRILDAGCGTGVYAKAMLQRGAAHIVGVDVSEKMLLFNRERNAAALEDGRLELHQANLAEPLPFLDSASFDIVVAPLVFDYIKDWLPTLREFYRVLAPGGVLVFSCGHPMGDYLYFKSEHYFETESVEAVWRGFGEPFTVRSYRRPLNVIINPVIDAGFTLNRVLEPLPTEDFKQADPKDYEKTDALTRLYLYSCAEMTYKLTEIEKETVKDEMRAALIQLARTRQIATYTEFTLMIHSVMLHPHSFIFMHLLREVCGREWERTGVMLCALVVSKTTGVPGGGYFRGMADLGYDCSDIDRCWREEVERVFAYWNEREL